MPVGVLIIMMIVVPVALAVFFGVVEMRRRRPLVFRCSRCGCDFYRPAHRAFPDECSECRARDWNRA